MNMFMFLYVNVPKCFSAVICYDLVLWHFYISYFSFTSQEVKLYCNSLLQVNDRCEYGLITLIHIELQTKSKQIMIGIIFI